MRKVTVCAKMNALSIYKNYGSIELGNIIDDIGITTADHDGKAIILIATE